YLTGHNEEGAGLLILPPTKVGGPASGPRETLFLPAKNPQKEKWNGVRMSPSDPGIEARTGFASVKQFDTDFRSTVENLAKTNLTLYTILPYQKELGGYPHEKEVVDWLQLAAPQAKLKDVRAQIGAMRQIKSPGELAFLKEAIDLSLDSHLEALKPGMDFCNKNGKSVQKIAYAYIDTHGKDLHGKSLGLYFIHGLGHHIGLNVHDPGDHCAPFQPGMVITIEPGIYIPEENLGVRIEDDVLITESGHKLLSERLPRDPDEIEKIMAAAAARRAKGEVAEGRGSNS